MALTITVRLRFGRYDAGALDPLTPEWPPHPARLFCALVASAVESADWDALGWLEAVGVPEVWFASEHATSLASGYVVVNATAKQGSLKWPGRTNGLRRRVSAMVADDTFAVVWPEAQPDDATLGRLSRLASRVPYVGRSTSWAEVVVAAGLAERRSGWATYRMVPLGTAGSTQLRVPFPGYLAELRRAYDDGNRSWHVAARTVAYAPPTFGRGVEAAPLLGPYSDLLIWGIAPPGAPIGGDDVLTVTAALRRAVLSRVADPVPPEVSGHGADGRPHVAYLGMLDVGHAHANGHVLGLGIAVPREMGDTSLRILLRGLLGPTGDEPIGTLAAGRGRTLTLGYVADSPSQWGLREDRWRSRDGRADWITATPLMLDRFPKPSMDLAAVVTRSLVTAGYPEPAAVETFVRPAIPGAVDRPRRGTLPDRPMRRPLVHCRLRFARPVRGPVLAGSLRYLGCGLFVPEVPSADA
jgi:CRISPR-associated protein Csb2